MTTSRPSQTYLASAVGIGIAKDKSSFVVEFITDSGKHIGVAFVPQALLRLREQIDAILVANPGFGWRTGE